MTLIQEALRRAAMARTVNMNDSRATTDMGAGGASPLLTKMWPARRQACLQAGDQGTRSEGDGGSDYGQEEWPHVYADFSTMFDMSEEEGEEPAPCMATVVFEDALPEEGELDGGAPPDVELGYEETGGQGTAVPIGEAQQRRPSSGLLKGFSKLE
ncbi:hypothetical protein JG688_00014098 [Phytophthora aleatoria]|uniref:Uncharacterized protein n=1 Tax=Phytophthora aleatoria TaxID=2496075 RepID=A0A8J5IXH2_9STRA|nr:hypothetical protein JG688_00014098 [Phytophthora aleatoria]